jgi:hypothetical protein
MSISTRPMSRITIGEAYYELLDSYESVTSRVEELDPMDTFQVLRWDNHKRMLVRVGSIDTVQEAGY